MVDDAAPSTPVTPAETVTDPSGLDELYRAPHPLVLDKVVDHIDPSVEEFLSQSPLFVLATSDGDGLDASPRGGPPGFLRVLDERHVAFGDLAGNNRIDSYRNLVSHASVGLLAVVPGLDETVRINGKASVVTDAGIRQRCEIDGRVPKVAIVVEVAECYLHCGKAFRRGGVWDPASWPAPEGRASAGQIAKETMGLDVDASRIEADLEAGYQATMWESGGT